MSFLDEDDKGEDATPVIRARGSLKEARRWFAIRGWDVLPKSDRGEAILKWAADQAYLAAPAHPMRSVIKWCKRHARLNDEELDKIIEYVRTSNKRWSPDQSAATLEVTMRDRMTHGFRFIGAEDDPHYDIRNAVKREKNAARNRRYRAARATGRKPGRPKSADVPAWKAAGFNSKATYHRHKARGLETEIRLGKSLKVLNSRETKNARRHISKNIGSVTQLKSHVSRMPAAIIRASAIDLDGIDFAKFGIVAIRVMRGTDIVRLVA
jgi:hypothetical protein